MLKLTLTSVTPLTPRIKEFSFLPRAGQALPDWSAGAHIDVDTHAGARSYSLIRWPGDEGATYRIAVLHDANGTGGSTAMHGLSSGTELTAHAPSNDFALQDTARGVALLAGGIGVTPLISMASDLQVQGRAFVFHYAGRSARDMAYLDELRTAFGDRLITHFDDHVPIDLTALAHDLADHDLYICGPKGMIDAARTAAEAAGIPADHIHVELFTAAQPEDGDSSFEVEIASSGQVITVGAEQSIIDALEDAGLEVMYDCQRGDCGICQTDVISGTPDHRDVVLSQSEKDAGTFMQICVSRALSQRLVLDL